MIRVEHLVYEYPGKRALSDVSFHLPEGSITALVGPNGAGKTTLMRCLAALDEPFSGTIWIDGMDVAENPREIHKKLGYLSDFFGLYNNLTIEQCLDFMARLHQIPAAEVPAQIKRVSDLLELTPHLKNKASTLSRGWRQRLGIAQAIIHNPRLLLLDEPASGLDPEARMALSGLFRRLRDEGMTLLVSSHILAELEDYCTGMLVLREGCVVDHGFNTSEEKTSRTIEISFLESAGDFLSLLQQEAHVIAPRLDGNSIHLQFSGTPQDQHILLKKLIGMNAKISHFSAQQARLQDVYMSLAGGKQ